MCNTECIPYEYRVLMAEVSGGRVRERQRLGWMDGVKVKAAVE